MKTKSERWEAHKRIWNACERCPQAAWTCRKTLYRGDSFLEKPLDVLFIGEAPGRQENVSGKPFVGPAGDVLDSVIRHLKKRFVFRWGVTNVVSCLPDLDAGDMTPPSKQQVANCSDRLSRLIKLAEPKAFVFLGQSAAKRFKHVADVWMKTPCGKETQNLLETAFILSAVKGDLRVHKLAGSPNEYIRKTCFLEVVHPAYVVRLPGDPDISRLQYQDVCRQRFDVLADASLIRRKPSYEKSL